MASNRAMDMSFVRRGGPPNNAIRAIADYIRPHNPDRAATFVEELLDHCGLFQRT
jgi:hypothetical protein